MSSNIIELENQLPGVASWGIGKGLEGNNSLHAVIYPNCIQTNGKVSIYCASENNNDLLKIEIFRLGWYSSSGSRPIVTLNDVEAKNKKSWSKPTIVTRIRTKRSNDYFNSVLDKWNKTTEIKLDEKWAPGIYHARITNENGLRYLHPFWIFDPSSKSKGIMVFPTISNQKLNSYGNYPTRKEIDYSIIRPFSNSRYGNFFKWCQPIISKLEKLGLDYVQITDQQLDINPELLQGKEIMICCGDFRFMTKKIKNAINEFTNNGGKLISTEGNILSRIIDLNSEGKVSFITKNHDISDIKCEVANVGNIQDKIGEVPKPNERVRIDAIRYFSKLNWDIIESENVSKKLDNKKTDMFKITILTCVWKRPELTKCVLEYYRDLKEILKKEVHIDLLAIGSEGNESKILCEKSGFDYVESKNKPLSDKWEIGINSCKKYDSDAVVIVGSDDLLSIETLLFLVGKIREGLLLVGLKDMYLYDSILRKLYHWQGYANDSKQSMNRGLESIGMGRCISKKLLELVNYSIWKHMKINKGLDGAMTRKFSSVGILPITHGNEIWMELIGGEKYAFGHVAFEMKETGGIAVDIKTSENVTSISKYQKVEADSQLLLEYFKDESIYNYSK